MLSLNDLLSESGPIARRVAGYEPRPQQVEMAAAVEQAMERREQLVVEAGTGVGKSFAYLLPAIRRIVDHEERVVVVTHTIALQEQLIEKDIPLLNAVIPEEFTAVLVKGRNNYLSLRRLKLASERQDTLFGDDPERRSLHAITEWAYATRDGSLSTLPVLERPSVWDYARSDAHNCMGRACPTYDRCFYQSARRRMQNGDLLVCNHAMFFADLALRAQGVSLLPPYNHVIIDEAHAAEDVAAEHFGVSLSEGQVNHLLRLLYHPTRYRGFLSSLHIKDDAMVPVERAIEQTMHCHARAEVFFAALASWQARHGPSNGRIREQAIITNELSPALIELSQQLKLLKTKAATEADQYELNSYAVRAMEIARSAEALLKQEMDDSVYWIEGAEPAMRSGSLRGGPRRRLSLNCVAIEVADALRSRLFDREISVVLTSATLATSPGNFSHFVRRMGCDRAETLQLGSPFDHGRQMRLFVDRTMPTPEKPQYIDELRRRVERHVLETDGGAFVLFTSFQTLRDVARWLRPRLVERGYPVLVHGEDGPPGLLIRRFRDDERSVLFGTASFWQGVDVRGRGLRNVIMTRLPFDVPDRPLIEARIERIEQRGGRPFTEETIPRAIIRFKQGVGRLIRSATDSGQVVVLDARIATKPYGRMFLASMPEGVVAQEVGSV